MRLASFYTKHREFRVPASEILTLLQSAYALDYPRAGYEIGRLYELGDGVPQDLERAAAYYFEVFDAVAEAGIRPAALSREGRIKAPSTRFAADLEAARSTCSPSGSNRRSTKSMLALARLYQSEPPGAARLCQGAALGPNGRAPPETPRARMRSRIPAARRHRISGP